MSSMVGFHLGCKYSRHGNKASPGIASHELGRPAALARLGDLASHKSGYLHEGEQDCSAFSRLKRPRQAPGQRDARCAGMSLIQCFGLWPHANLGTQNSTQPLCTPCSQQSRFSQCGILVVTLPGHPTPYLMHSMGNNPS